MIRARAGVGYALTEAMDEGHCERLIKVPIADSI
jgi:hypothetical protein